MSDEIDPSRETLVFPSRTVSRQYQKYFMKTRRLNAVDGSRFIEWDRFTEKLRRVPDGEFRSIKPIMRRLFTEMLIEENISRPFLNYLIPAPAAGKSRSYRGILNQALSELSLFAADQNAFDSVPALQSDLIQILNKYRSFLKKNGLFDPLLEAKQPSVESECYRIFYPEILPDFENYEALFADNVRIEPIPENSGWQKVKMFASDSEEIRFVFCEIEKLIRSGEPTDNIAIACIDSGYRFLLEWFSGVYQIPLSFRRGKKLSEYSANRFFSNVNEAVRSQFSFSAFRELFFDPVLPWKPIRLKKCGATVDVPETLMRAFNEINVPAGVRRLLKELRRVSPEAAELFGELQPELEKIVKAASFRALNEKIQKFLRTHFDDSRRDDRSRQPYRSALDLLAALEEIEKMLIKNSNRESVFEKNGIISPFEFWLRELESEIYVEQDSTAKIAVYNEKVAAGAPIPYLFVIGIHEDSYRFVSGPFEFLSDFDRREILRNERQREFDRTEKFYRLYQATPGCQSVFTGAFSVRGERKFAPSWFFANNAVDSAPDISAVRYPEILENALSSEQLQRSRRLFPNKSHSSVFGYNPEGEKRIQITEDEFTVFREERLLDKKRQKLKISNSAMEKMLACPFSWFFSKFKLTEMKTDLISEEGRQTGILVHRIAEFYEKECAAAVNVESDEKIRRQTVKTFLDSFFERYENPESENPITIPDFVKPHPVLWEAWKENAYDWFFVFSEADRLLFGACRTNLLEQKFETETDDGVLLEGRIDRIVRDKDRFYLIDYKTKNIPRAEEICPEDESKEIKKFQIAFYDLLTADKGFGTLAGAFYYAFTVDRPGFKAVFCDEDREACEIVEPLFKRWPADTEQMRRSCLRAAEHCVQSVLSKNYAVQKSDDACQYCLFGSICRVNFGIKG